ncbi:TetR/AcrR family transcriptional regulator [Dactylosporangium sp. NPDC005572]|uniref:TetR/AcrR family transcriptional regulator n=1 Tax=Dactylosporangium sp. NPDC005572 TaxID=3156889 RepID=UPI0033B5F522
MPKGVTKRRPETLGRLLDAAGEVFAECGFRGAGIEEICRRAGYTRGAFYSNFATREELFFALFDRHAARALTRVEELAAQASGALTVPTIAEMLARVHPDERSYFLVATEFSLHAMRDAAAAEVLSRRDRELQIAVGRLVIGLLERAGRAVEVPPQTLGRMIIVIREGALLQSFVDPVALPPGQLERQMFDLLLSALSGVAVR